MSLSSLQVLADNRNALLLAEVAALLHDVGKFTDLHIEHHATNPSRKWSNDDAYKVVVDDPASVIRLSKDAANIKKPDILNNVLNASSPKAADFLPQALKQNLQSLHVNLLGQDYSLAELIMLGMPGFATHQQRQQLLDGKDGWLPAVLGLCHNVAHVDKEDPIGGEQSLPNVLLSNAFGYEQQIFILGDPQKSLDARLSQISFDFTRLAEMRQQILNAFADGLGDTRRPTNEVSLADWSAVVAALFKTALAGAVLTQTTQARPEIRQWKSWRDKIIDHDFHWRLLRVNFDVLGLYAKAVRISDLLGYQRAVEEACKAVKKLVEEEYPLGNEVYRDTTGIYFTFPDIDLPADLEQEIRRLVEGVEPELAPRIAVTVGDGQTATEQLKGILAKARREALQALAQPFDSQNLSTCWQQLWEVVGAGKWELCPVCRLRPKQAGQDTCEHCEKRRSKRAEKWAQGSRQDTIWLDEVVDTNGRLALIVGQFALDDWLSGELVQTMLVRADPQAGTFTPKNPSPARLRRVWETTQRFWQTALEGRDEQGNPLIPSVQGRWHITPQNPMPSKVAACHTYDLLIQDRRLSVLWDGGKFITCDNLDYFEKTANARLQNLLQSGCTYELWTPAGYGEKTRKVADVTIGQAQQDSTAYTPAIPILAEPRTFMALVPANRALKVVIAIKAKYEREMGKVRNRLPLTLGVVYFGRRTPLAAAIEAGRRMLERPASEQTWEVTSKTDCHSSPSGWPGAVCLTLKRNDREVSLSIPTVMGDGTTPDVWYPYWRVEGKPSDRTRYFIGPDGEHWVHVTDLRQGDRVGFMPSTFDFEYLDTTARRFEVIYDPKDGQRLGATKRQRPYLLEEVDTLEAVWQKVCAHLTTSQIQQLEMLIENRRQAWLKLRSLSQERDGELEMLIENRRQAWDERRGTLQVDQTFQQFVRDALWEAGAWSDTLEKAALRGMLSDVLEIHMTVHKEKPEKVKKEVS